MRLFFSTGWRHTLGAGLVAHGCGRLSSQGSILRAWRLTGGMLSEVQNAELLRLLWKSVRWMKMWSREKFVQV